MRSESSWEDGKSTEEWDAWRGYFKSRALTEEEEV